jgi:hypothetical protein
MNMDNMLTQIDDDILDQVSGGKFEIGGSIGVDPIGQLLSAIGEKLSSLPVFYWGFDAGFRPGSKG